MTLIESICELIFTIFISFLFSGGLIILIGAYYLRPDKLEKIIRAQEVPKKSRPEDDYLVVCRTKKYAMELRKRLLNCVSGCYLGNEIKVINNYGKFICLYFTRTHTIVRFISEAGYYEASKGFRGWIVEENQLEEWLDAAEKNQEV